MTERPAASRRSVLAAPAAAPLAGGLAVVPGTAAASRGSGGVPDALRPGGEFDLHLAELAVEDTFSGTVLLTRRGRTVLSRSHRMADKARGVPNGPDTVFSLGSITKMFTGVAIGQLVERGRLAYGDRVGTYVDGLLADVADVTIHQLLTHTSGLGNFQSPEYNEQSRTWKSVEECWNGTFEFVRRCELGFAPGSGRTYSNAGFFLLGAVVAKVVAGTSPVSPHHYYAHVRQNVFERAGMTDSDFYTLPQRLASRRIAHNYGVDRQTGELVDTTERFGFIGLPPGDSHSSAPDLVNFTKALRGSRLLSEPHTHLLTSPKLPEDDSSGYEAYSIDVELRHDQWVLGHNGGSSLGVSCQVDWFPDTDWVVVILSSYGNHAIKSLVELAREAITTSPVVS